MRETHLAGPRRRCRHRPAPPWRPNDAARERAAASTAPSVGSSRPATLWIAVTSSDSALVSAGRIVGKSAREHRLPCAGRTDEQRAMPAGGGDRERALGALLAGDVGEVDRVVRSSGDRVATRRRQSAAAPEPVHELRERARAPRAERRARATPRRGSRAAAPASDRRRALVRARPSMPRDRERAPHGANAAVEPELTDERVRAPRHRRRRCRCRRARRARSEGRTPCPPSARRPARGSS